MKRDRQRKRRKISNFHNRKEEALLPIVNTEAYAARILMKPKNLFVIRQNFPISCNGRTEYVDVRNDGTFYFPNGEIGALDKKELKRLMKEYKQNGKYNDDYEENETGGYNSPVGYENYNQNNGYTMQDSGFSNESQQRSSFGSAPQQHPAFEAVTAEHYGDEAYSNVILGQADVNIGDGKDVTVDVYADGTIVLPDGRRVGIEEASFKDCVDAINVNRKMSQSGYAEPTSQNEAKKAKEPFKRPSRSKKEKPKRTGGIGFGKRRENKEPYSESSFIPESDEAKSIKRKKTVAVIVYIVIIAGVFFLANYMLKMQEKEVNIIRFKKDVLAGEVITEDMIESWPILERQFASYDSGTVMNDNGEETTQRNLMLTWNEREEVIGKFAAYYTQAGQYVKRNSVTDVHVVRNPWLSEIEPGQEIYTLPFSPDGVDIRMLVPGMPMRVRAVIEQEVGKDGNGTEGLSSAGTNALANPFEVPEETVDNSVTSDINSESLPPTPNTVQNMQYANSTEGTNVETYIIIDNLIAVDMLNSSKESIFDIYMALAKMPINQRIKYLETSIENNKTQSFQSRVTPSSLVFILDKEKANELAKFEFSKGITLKYTLLPLPEENGDMSDLEKQRELAKFIEVNDQIVDLYQNANVGKAAE